MTTSLLRHRPVFQLHAGPFRLELGKRTKIMGIVNVTPDSFSGDGCLKNDSNVYAKAIRRAQKLIREGADIIDIGGESTRPGASKVSVKEERERVIPVIQRLTKCVEVPISVDSYKPSVAKEALDHGATIVNNIMGVKPDLKLLKMVRDYDAAIVLMHIQGSPKTMQKRIAYGSLIEEIVDSLKKSIEKCLEIGIKSDRIITDPGIGFGKTVEHNLKILNCLSSFNVLNQPLLIGTSRKSFIGKTLQRDVQHRLIGSIASVCIGISRGAHIVRVHDVKQTKEAVDLTDAILNSASS